MLKLEKLNEKRFDEVYRIMESSFPIDEYRPYTEQKMLLQNDLYSIYASVCPQTGTVQGFITVWEFERIAFVEHFAVASSARNSGLGSKMLQALMELLKKQICLEVELPNDEMAIRRIGFYQRNGFVLNDYEYMQPSISAGRKPIPLKIMTTESGIDEAMFQKIKSLLYTYVYQQSVTD